MPTDPIPVNQGVIDLGVIGPAPDWAAASEADSDVLTGTPAGRRNPLFGGGPVRRWVRWSQAAVLTMAMLVGLAAAAPAAPSLQFAYVVPVAQRSAVALTDDTLYVVTGTPASATVEDPLWWLHAYRLEDGSHQWRVLHNVSARHSSVDVTVVDGVPVVTGWRTYTAPMSRPPTDLDGYTTAYDPATGTPLWTRPGFIGAVGPGRLVLEHTAYSGNPPDPVRYQVTGVELATGQRLWTHEQEVGPQDPEAFDVWGLSGDGEHLVSMRRDGWLTVRRLDTGATTGMDVGMSWHDASLLLVGDTLRVSLLKDRRRTMVVYQLDPLRQRWRMPDLPVASTLLPCGPVLCLYAGGPPRALDPHSGEQRWRPESGWLAPVPLEAPWPPGSVQVLRSPETSPDSAGQAVQAVVVDAGSGEVAWELGRWRSFSAGAAHHPYPVVELREDGAYRPGHPGYDPGRLWLGRWDTRAGQVEILGVVDQARSCEVHHRHVACLTTDQEVLVWRIR